MLMRPNYYISNPNAVSFYINREQQIHNRIQQIIKELTK